MAQIVKLKQGLNQHSGVVLLPEIAQGQTGKTLRRVQFSLNKWSRTGDRTGTSTLPPNFGALQKVIERASEMLEWKDDWDGEGSPGYTQQTWDRATKFLQSSSIYLWRNCGINLIVPRILPGPDGSIDIHWKTRKSELLINVPASPEEKARYYGDNLTEQIVKGSLDILNNNQWLMLWLMQ